MTFDYPADEDDGITLGKTTIQGSPSGNASNQDTTLVLTRTEVLQHKTMLKQRIMDWQAHTKKH